MSIRATYDAVVIGSGPNGLAAAITLLRRGKKTLILEAQEVAGGGMRSAELTLPGCVSDVCSTIFSFALLSPFFKTLPLARYGVEWVYAPFALAHPFDDGTAAALDRSVRVTADSLGEDGPAYVRLIEPLLRQQDKIIDQFLGPFRPPRHPLVMAHFGALAALSARALANLAFRTDKARAFFLGMAGHSMLPPEQSPTAAFGLLLALTAHGGGWPVARGGSQKVAGAMAAYVRDLGGEIVTGSQVNAWADLPPARAYLFDTTPRALARIAGEHLPEGFRTSLEAFRYGTGVFKVDWALDAPVPWKADACRRAMTLHLAGSSNEISESEHAAEEGRYVERPYMLVVQQSLFDPTRVPEGKQVVWGYCHVPSGSTRDVTDAMETQIERFAPGFRSHVLVRSKMNAADYEAHNANYIGGDINGGVQDWAQLFTRPTVRLDPYSTPEKDIYLCSSSTPPGGGVHGMSGYYAALSALQRAF